ncbi:claudin-7-B-like isoform X1 [Sparus aurata]|uniref:claudin-7-B-like isoform X1 n=1 Tax=Sparus aurata TaxID=8175 RepID=UPI0011C0E82F|nr:claudin-7-B-like isoform X1 [Sparus aurata]
MANKGLQILGFALALLGLIGLIIGTILPQWKMSAYVGDNIITAIAMYEGLWMSCAFQSTGQIQCKVYDSILQLNSALQATRALMIVSIIVTVAGLGVACMGMKCTNCGGDDKTKKSRIAMTGGIIILIGCKTPLFKLVSVSRPSVSLTPETVSVTFCFALLAALCSIVACSWYAHDIIQAFYNPFTPVNTKYEFGSAIFIAWAGAFLAVVGGGMLAASCPRGKPSPKYPISRPPSSKEYV